MLLGASRCYCNVWAFKEKKTTIWKHFAIAYSLYCHNYKWHTSYLFLVIVNHDVAFLDKDT